MDKPYSLYLIDSSGTCLFNYDFRRELQSVDPILFSGFLTAIIQFADQLQPDVENVGPAEESSTISNISFDVNLEFIIEHRENLMGAIVIEKQSNSSELRDFLQLVLDRFILRYSSILKDWNKDLCRFEGFSDELELIFRKRKIYSYQIPKKIDTIASELILEAKPLENFLDGTKTIQEIAELTNLSIEDISRRISKLWWADCVELSQSVGLDDIYEPRKDLFVLLRSKPSSTHSEDITIKKTKEFGILRRINGFSTVNEIDTELENISLGEIQKTISFYLSKDAFLRKVKLFPQILQIGQDVKNQFAPNILALIFTLENICDGDLSLEDISKKTGVPILIIKAVLNQLGEDVTYRKEYVF